jgi:hypothetical protein
MMTIGGVHHIVKLGISVSVLLNEGSPEAYVVIHVVDDMK